MEGIWTLFEEFLEEEFREGWIVLYWVCGVGLEILVYFFVEVWVHALKSQNKLHIIMHINQYLIFLLLLQPFNGHNNIIKHLPQSSIIPQIQINGLVIKGSDLKHKRTHIGSPWQMPRILIIIYMLFFIYQYYCLRWIVNVDKIINITFDNRIFRLIIFIIFCDTVLILITILINCYTIILLIILKGCDKYLPIKSTIYIDYILLFCLLE